VLAFQGHFQKRPLSSLNPEGREGGGSPYNRLYMDAPPEKDTFFGLQVRERSPFYRLEVCEMGSFSEEGERVPIFEI